MARPEKPQFSLGWIFSESSNPSPSSGESLLVLNASSQSEIDTAFTTLVEQRAGALLVTGEPLSNVAPEPVVRT
jgi:hypothetical protein